MAKPMALRVTPFLQGLGGPACLSLPTPLPASFLPTSRHGCRSHTLSDFFLSRLPLTWEFHQQCSLCLKHCFTMSPTHSSCLSVNVTLSWQPLLLSLEAAPLPCDAPGLLPFLRRCRNHLCLFNTLGTMPSTGSELCGAIEILE